MPPTDGPLTTVAGDERVASLDALRGVALWGVLAVNLVTGFRVDLFGYYFGARPAAPRLDRAVERALDLFVESKAFIVFSFLFGVGLAIQAERVRARGRPFAPFALRRLLALLALGLAHLTLVWDGDILTEYALVGLLVATLLGARTRALLAVAAACLAVYVAQPELPLPWFEGEALARHVAEAHRAYGGGSYGVVLAFRLSELPYIATLLVGVAPRTAALFLLGAGAWRAGLLRAPSWRRSLAVALAAFALGGLAMALRARGASTGWVARLVELVAAFGQAAGYAATVVALAGLRRAWLAPFEAVGRMALTNYLAQSVVLGFMFYGYGLGRFDRMGAAHALALGAALYAAQACASAAWLRRFRYGPVEWLWRSATYARWQPMR